jgi:8-oxo-dGTP pyrophosphatase MutT (NUDIX family)
MDRFSLITKLQNYLPIDQKELEYKNQMIAFINENNNCFDRTLAEGHVTASAWLLNNHESRALLMHHSKLDKWFQLGGHCDGNPDVLAVAIKEAQEESGIENIEPISNEIFDIDIHLIPENPKEKAHYHYDVRFLLKVTSNEQIVQNNESKELRWIRKDLSNLPTQNTSVVRMFKKWLNANI